MPHLTGLASEFILYYPDMQLQMPNNTFQDYKPKTVDKELFIIKYFEDPDAIEKDWQFLHKLDCLIYNHETRRSPSSHMALWQGLEELMERFPPQYKFNTVLTGKFEAASAGGWDTIIEYSEIEYYILELLAGLSILNEKQAQNRQPLDFVCPTNLYDFNPGYIDKEELFELYAHCQRLVEDDLMALQQVDSIIGRYKTNKTQKMKGLLLCTLNYIEEEIPLNSAGYELLDTLSAELTSQNETDLSPLENLIDEMYLGICRISPEVFGQSWN